MNKQSLIAYTIILVLIPACCPGKSSQVAAVNSNHSNSPVTVEKNEKTLTISCGDDKILSYFHATHDVPEGVDPSFRRSGFIHPLYSPAGHVLTRIQPPDHYHHYGIWAPWTKTFVEGEQVDFWNLGKKQGTVRFAKLLSKGDSGFKVLQEHTQFLPNDRERIVLNEVLDVQAAAEEVQNQRVWVVDLVSEFKNLLDTPVILDKYRYGGGLGFRATQQWNKDNCTVLTSEGKTRNDADGTRARWCDVRGQTGNKGETSGVLFMSHPDNRQHPEPMRVWPDNMIKGQMFFEFCPIRFKGWTLEPNKEYVLRYRMVVYDGTLKPETMESLWQNYAKSPVIHPKSE